MPVLETAANDYLDLLKKVLTNVIYRDPPVARSKYQEDSGFELAQRARGNDWPSSAHTMVGLERLDNVQHCVETVLADDVPGDLIETGVWRGGVCIFMRAVLRAHGVRDRKVWAADSFQGMPEVPAQGHPGDRRVRLHEYNEVLGVSLDTVRRNFATYGLLDDQVEFLPGWFRDTLPSAPVERLSVLRLDGDLYESTMDSLAHLYPRLSPGGFVIVDDYGLPACRLAVAKYRAEHGIDDPIESIDEWGAYWRRGG
ncbi:TylF/MycF family methyltransferase [Amycolatopsis sp. NPDC004079]|uniref:TylF/MycF family methyltransferase n=1 Tax=Amycolatopsis sp. NPDC004079 TaxID=3154549 RepID=UPI0033A2DB16